MNFDPNGELVPIGGGDPIPLVRPVLTVGRRASCDICLHFPNISGTHCELAFIDGSWIIRDMNSTNGIKVNGTRVIKKVLHPGNVVTIAKRHFTINYTISIGRQVLAEILEESEAFNSDIPLLEKAGLAKSQQSIDRLLGKSIDRGLPQSIDKPQSIDQPLKKRIQPSSLDEDDDDED